ncbi:hypothetical protein [Sporocytophaga myxococcoides]|uniref:hypothetical protein n=1 Tax=Sporocytophaga myxococcoides TaxID=153721 RepID=UPI000405CCCC|nr:hypothetical protein [Sporocytophaga myxococcoides]
MKKNSLLVIIIFAVLGVFAYAVTEHLKLEECKKEKESSRNTSFSVIKNLTEENHLLRAANDSLQNELKSLKQQK